MAPQKVDSVSMLFSGTGRVGGVSRVRIQSVMLYYVLMVSGETVAPQKVDSVSMLFSDLVGFTAICSTATPLQVVNMLNTLYTQFDSCCGWLDVYKVSTLTYTYSTPLTHLLYTACTPLQVVNMLYRLYSRWLHFYTYATPLHIWYTSASKLCSMQDEHILHLQWPHVTFSKVTLR